MYRVLLFKHCRNAVINKPSNLLLHTTKIPLQQAGIGKVILFISPFVVGGTGVVQYAKYDKEFRSSLVKNVPAIEPVLELLLDDGNPFANVQNKINEYQKKISETTSSITSSVSGFTGSSFKEKKEANVSSVTKSSPLASKDESIKSTPIPLPPLSKPVEPVKNEQKSSPISISDKTEKLEIPKNIADLEKAIESAATTAIDEYNKAVNSLKLYNEEVKKIVDSSTEAIDINVWSTLKNKTMTRDNALRISEDLALAARKKLNELEQQVEKSSIELSEEVKLKLKANIAKFNDHLNAAKVEVLKAKDFSGTTETYWKKVEKARSYFVNEMEALFGVNLDEKKMNLSKEEIDLFLLNAYSHVLAYQKELNKLQTEGELKLQRALDAVRGTDQTESVKAQLEFEIEKEKRSLNLQNQTKILKIKAETEKNLREQLKKQIEAHSDHLNDALATKEVEMKRLFARELDEKLANERASYNTQLAEMLGKLKGMDSALKEIDEELKERADAEKSAHQAQSLWAACQTLWSSLREGQPGKSWRTELRPLKNEVKSVSIAGEGDELVSTIINTLPEIARERGVFPEEALRERFVNVEKVARRLALVPAEGASLPVYLLSFIQGALIMQSTEVISKEELEDKEIDFSKLDTYDILNRAKYWNERGNLTQTLKYMNLLKGAARKVCDEWASEVVLLLETQQAVNILLSHSSGNGQRYL